VNRLAGKYGLFSIVAGLAALLTVTVWSSEASAHHEQPPLIDGVSTDCANFGGFYFGSPEFASLGLFFSAAEVDAPGWVWVDPSAKNTESARFRVVSGEVKSPDRFSEEDFPVVHDSHDFALDVQVDPEFMNLLSGLNSTGILHVEWETGIKPDELSGDGANPTFPSWAWPSQGDRFWASGHWIFDCGHGEDLGNPPEEHFRTELHPMRAVASMRQQFHALPGSGTTPVAVTATDLYVHGMSGFATDDLACGANTILEVPDPTDPCVSEPHRGTPIATDYTFEVCMPALPSGFDKALPQKTFEDGPGNTVQGIEPQLTFVPASGACTADPSKYDPTLQLEVTVPLAGSSVQPTDVYARKIYAGWVYPPANPHHLKVTLNRMVLHDDKDMEPADPAEVSNCECTFFFMNVDRSPSEWIRLAGYDQATDSDPDVLCPGDNTLDSWDDDGGCGEGGLDFSGPTFDFFVGDNQPFTVRAEGQDQDCVDGKFGRHNMLAIVDPTLLIELANCFIPFGLDPLGACGPAPFDIDECGQNDLFEPFEAKFAAPGYGIGAHDIANPVNEYNMQFTVEDAPLGGEDSADLALTKDCKPNGSVFAGTRFTCTILVQNPGGPGLPRDVVVEDTLLTDVSSSDYTLENPTFTFAGLTNLDDPCIDPAVNPIEDIPGGKEFTCKIQTVPVGGKAIISVNIVSREGGDFNNFARVNSASQDANLADNKADDSIHVTAAADLAIVKSDTPDPLVAGTNITYTIQLTNVGPSKAVNVAVDDFLPAGISILSVGGGFGSACSFGVPGNDARPTTCNYNSLPATASRTMTVVVHVNPGDYPALQNDARVRSDTYDPNNGNNLASAATTIKVADLALTKTSNADSYKSSEQITYTLTVRNNGPGAAENVVITDNLPVGKQDRVFVYDSSCALSGPVLTCQLGTLAPTAVRSLSVAIILKGAKGAVSNTATVSTSTFDPDNLNNSATRVVSVGSLPKP
jgi:uncharacterized repeat protein (TIGR01451 family)